LTQDEHFKFTELRNISMLTLEVSTNTVDIGQSI
jgi:hypothetical protein